MFLKKFWAGCDLILCATRTSGESVMAVNNLHNVHNDLMWITKYRSWKKAKIILNKLSAEHIFELVRKVIRTKLND